MVLSTFLSTLLIDKDLFELCGRGTFKELMPRASYYIDYEDSAEPEV